MGMGLAGLLFIGGILNLLSLAYPIAIAGLIAIGLINSACHFLFPARRELNQDTGEKRRTGPWSPGSVAVIAFISVVMGFVVFCLLPSREFNTGDDFQKYFDHPVRMLQTGSVAGSPLNAMGAETLGGKAFLDGFFISFFPMGYINGSDAVLGFFLCLLLAARFAGRQGSWALVTLAALFCLVAINPQCVNISALYLGSALIMLSIAISMDGEGGWPESMPSAAALALVYAAMISLKGTYVLFPAFHLPMVMAGIGVSRKRILPAVDWAVRTGLWLALFISPWVLLHATRFIAGWCAPGGDSESPLGVLKLPEFFSFKALFYGNSIAHYTWAVGLVLFGALTAGMTVEKLKGRLRQDAWMLIGAAAAGAMIYILSLLFIPALIGVQGTVRYYAPFLIGIAPAIFGSMGAQLSACGPDSRGIARLSRVFPVSLALLAGVPFLGTAYGRAKQAHEKGSILAFPDAATSNSYYAYNQNALGSVIRAKMERAQRMIPEGETVIVWVKIPFALNFSRNVLYDVNSAGLAQSWAVMPVAHYLLWQHPRGLDEQYMETAKLPAIKVSRESRQAIKFQHSLDSLIKSAQKIYEDGDLMVYKLGKPEEAVH